GAPRTVFLASERRSSPVAFHVHLEDRRVMYEAIHRSERHGGILKDLSPFSEGLIRRDENRAAFVAGTDELEQHGGFRLVLGHVHQIVQNQQMVTIQTLDGRLKCELATGELKLLHQIRGAGEEHPPTFLEQGESDRGGQMRFAAAGWPKEEQVGSLIEPPIAGAER